MVDVYSRVILVFLADTTRYLNVSRREKFDQSQPGRQQRAGLCFGVFDG